MFLSQRERAPEESWPAMLARLAATRAMVSVVSLDDAIWRNATRVRVLAASAEEMIVAGAGADEQLPALRLLDRVSMTISDRGQHWLLRMRVAAVLFHAEATGHRRPALRLSIEDAQPLQQRRSFFRVDMAGLGLAPALLNPIARLHDRGVAGKSMATESAAAQQTLSFTGADDSEMLSSRQSFRGDMLDLSGGGIAIRAADRHTRGISIGDRVSCTVDLPMIVQRFVVPAQVRHLSPLPRKAARIGMAFEFTDDPIDRRLVDDICRFSTWLQTWEARRGE